jgi:hypothetical protein
MADRRVTALMALEACIVKGAARNPFFPRCAGGRLHPGLRGTDRLIVRDSFLLCGDGDSERCSPAARGMAPSSGMDGVFLREGWRDVGNGPWRVY